MSFLKNDHGVVFYLGLLPRKVSGFPITPRARRASSTAAPMRSHGEAAKGFACVPQPQWFWFGLAFNNTAEERGEIRRFHKLTVITPPTKRNRDINLEHNRPTVAPINRSRRKRAFKNR